MWNTIKQSIQQHFIILWIASCFTIILCGIIYLAIKIEQKWENAFQHLVLWLVIWVYITAMGIFAGVLRMMIDVTNKEMMVEDAKVINRNGVLEVQVAKNPQPKIGKKEKKQKVKK